MAGVSPGDTVVYSARGRSACWPPTAPTCGAPRVYAVDLHTDRLALAERFDATPVNVADGDPAKHALEATHGLGADRGIEAVGYQAHDTHRRRAPRDGAGRPGPLGPLHVRPRAWSASTSPGSPGPPAKVRQEGRIGFDYGTLFQQGQPVGTGQCPVKRYNEPLRDLIVAGRATPSLLVSHELVPEQAPGAYERFDKRAGGYTKVLLHPAEPERPARVPAGRRPGPGLYLLARVAFNGDAMWASCSVWLGLNARRADDGRRMRRGNPVPGAAVHQEKAGESHAQPGPAERR